MWRIVSGAVKYEVSDHGRVRRRGDDERGRVLAGGKGRTGYRHVCIQAERGQWVPQVHRLVAAAFLGPRPAPPVGVSRIEICHKDGDRTNNHASNLKYGTPKQNAADSIAHGTHTSCAQKAMTHCKRGHEFTEANTRYGPTGSGAIVRNCRKCAVLKNAQSRERVKARDATFG